MKKTITTFLTTALLAGAYVSASAAPACCATEGDAAEGASPGQLVLTSYGHVGKALASDNLEEAQNAARTLTVISSMSGQEELSDEARVLLSAGDLDEAREQFKKVSAGTLQLAEDSEDFNLFVCPAAGEGGIWLQTGDTPNNPYLGTERPECGQLTTSEELARDSNGDILIERAAVNSNGSAPEAASASVTMAGMSAEGDDCGSAADCDAKKAEECGDSRDCDEKTACDKPKDCCADTKDCDSEDEAAAI